jgi:hypothetical protein
VLAVTIHDGDTRRQNFGMVGKAFIRCVNAKRQQRNRPLRPVGRRLDRIGDDLRRGVS